jgi:hypothetical protein
MLRKTMPGRKFWPENRVPGSKPAVFFGFI